jgi:hypothetical protein
MTLYNAKVTAEFIAQRDIKVELDKREKHTAERQWDFEFAEMHQCVIDPMQTLYEGAEYDTTHKFFNNCDYKHVNRFNEIHISSWILQRFIEGTTNFVVAWKYINRPPWTRNLEAGDMIKYKILDHIPVPEILQAIVEKTTCRGFTIKANYDMIDTIKQALKERQAYEI